MAKPNYSFEKRLEIHILDFKQDIYGKKIDLSRITCPVYVFAGGDDDIPGVARDSESIQLPDNAGFRARRVGQEDDLAPGRAKPQQGRNGSRERRLAIVQAAPEVAEDGIVSAGKVREGSDDFGHSGALSPLTGSLFSVVIAYSIHSCACMHGR